MAAASAGTLQSGSAVPGSVPSSIANNIDTQLSAVLYQQQSTHQQQHQQQQPQLMHQQQQHQQQQQQQHQNQHQNLQFQQAPNLQIHQRNAILPRIGNVPQISGTINRHVAGSNEPINTVAGGGGIVAQQQMHHQQQPLQQQQILLQRQTQMTAPPNFAPGWRRLVSSTEVVYVSPSGAALRTHGQIKDYLLSPGTCKCGLPCPLRPEFFFDFNFQVPNTPLQIPLENGLPSRSSLVCMHQRRYLENQQNVLHKDVKRRKFIDISSSAGKISTSPVPQCNSFTLYSGNVMQPSQLVANNSRQVQMMSPQQIINSTGRQTTVNSGLQNHQIQQQQSQQQHGKLPSQQTTIIQQPNNLEAEKQIGSVTLSKTPPWRKNSILNQQNSAIQQPNNQVVGNPQVGQLYQSGNERVPPLPQAHLCQPASQQQSGNQSQQQPPPWQDHTQSRFIKQRVSVLPAKKKPNFKDDPTGYLDQQTAILHSSILNVVHSPGPNDSPSAERYDQIVKADLLENETNINRTGQSIKTEQIQPVMQQNQNMYPQNPIVVKQELIKVEPTISPHLPNKHMNPPSVVRLYHPSPPALPPSGQHVYHSAENNQIKQEIAELTQHHNQQQDQQPQQHHIPPQSSGFIYNQQPRMLAPPQLIETNVKSHHNHHHHLHNQHHLQQQTQQQHHQSPISNQQIIANVPSSQPYIVDNKQNHHQQQIATGQSYQIDDQHQQHQQQQHQQQQICRTINMAQATTTTIGGQTVTHFPNGMVQVEQNCDNIIPFKPQQQIQLQQQIQQHNMLYRQNQHIQKINGKTSNIEYTQEQKMQPSNATSVQVLVPASQESPVSSSTTFSRSTPESRNTPDNKGPAQVGAISTSNESPITCPSPIDSPESSQSSSNKPPTPISNNMSQGNLKAQHGVFATSHTTGRNTITSVTAGKTITATTSINDKTSVNVIEPQTDYHHHHHNHQQHQHHQQHPQKHQVAQTNIIPVSTSLTGIQMQSVVRDSGNQLIMTSTGQLIVMPTQTNKSQNQMIINSPNGNNLVVNNHHQQSVVINQQGAVVNNSQIIGNGVEVLNNQSNQTANLIQSPGSGLVIQNSSIVQATGPNLIHSPNNLLTNNSQNFIVNSSNNMQPVILNNSNIIHQQGGQNLITANAANILQSQTGSSLITTANGQKVISNNGSILNNQNIITNQQNVMNNQVISNSGNIISPNNGGIIGQQTVVLNALPNSYVIQPNFATVDGQVVGQLVNQDNGTTTFLQQQPQQQHQQQQQQNQQQRQIILTSPDSKRKGKKRKGSVSSSPSTPTSLSPQQSPTIQQQNASALTAQQTSNQNQGTMVQLATSPYATQGFQISPGIQGIAVVNKNAQSAGPQQQLLFQNGQIIQPLNLIGQQLLVPAGLVVAPDTTLLQIQNVGACGSIITPQGMVIRAPSPQNKNFLSPSGSGQQFIVSGNGQMSPMGQIYGTPVGLVVPQSTSGAAATFVQQNTTIVQQQTTMMSNNNNNNNNSNNNNNESSSNNDQQQNRGSASPPDTTTHSPRSPERPSSEKSGGSDMVQCVSSSEPDSVVSPVAADSAQSPSTTDYEQRSGSVPYQTNTMFKPSDAKIRRIQTPTLFNNGMVTQGSGSQMRPDSHESPTNSPPASATSTTSNLPTSGGNISGNGVVSGGGCGSVGQLLPSFCIGELVWGAARGHPAWPGKVVNPPDNICTPSDSIWVQWFGGRPHVELVAINTLKSLSEGLEAHHKAQKDARKSRKLNSQLERAIQEAMAELDRVSSSQPPSSTNTSMTSVSSRGKARGRQPSSNLGHQRTKPIRIAPAPSSYAITQPQTQQQHIRPQTINHHHQQQLHQHHQQQHQQQQQSQHNQASTTTQTK